MAARHEETVTKKIERMLGRFIFEEHRDDNLAMPDITEGCAEALIEIVSTYPHWTARALIPPIARKMMKGKARGFTATELPMLPGFEGLNLGFRFAVPPRRVVETEIEPIDEESTRTIWMPRHTITVGDYGRHVGSYIGQLADLQRETDLRNAVLLRAEALGGEAEEVLIDVLARGV